MKFKNYLFYFIFLLMNIARILIKKFNVIKRRKIYYVCFTKLAGPFIQSGVQRPSSQHFIPTYVWTQ